MSSGDRTAAPPAHTGPQPPCLPRAHPEACREYAALKRIVFARHADDMLAYNDGKNDWIKALEPIAIAWHRARRGLLA